MKNIYKITLLFFIWSYSAGQNKRDLFIQDSILNVLNNLNVNENEYSKLKNNILKLELLSGYEPEIKYHFLNKSFEHDDILYFKKEMTILVEKFGFNVAYMTGKEKYYNSIMTGDLSKWFKKMFLKYHLKWLENNFEKQLDLRNLNELAMKDQLVNGFAAEISQIPRLDSIQKKETLKILSKYFYKNAVDLYNITQKNNNYPNGKSFALIQNSFGIIEIHNLQAKDNYNNYWELFYQYYKKAYLKEQITYIIFRNYDNFSYLHYGFQVFGLINIKDIPEYFKKNNNEIPVKDPDFMNKIKSQFRW